LSKNAVMDGSSDTLVIERAYRPVHPVGHLRYLECSELAADGQPAGDLTPWGEIFFPYDPSLADRGELATLPVERRDHLQSEEIVETYRYFPDGTIRVQIENRTRGYRRDYVLGEPA
jgi:molecular chaperone DnaK